MQRVGAAVKWSECKSIHVFIQSFIFIVALEMLRQMEGWLMHPEAKNHV